MPRCGLFSRNRRYIELFRKETHFLVAPLAKKAKQRKILIFNENQDFLFPPNDNDCAKECNIKIS